MSGPRILAFREAEVPARKEAFEILVGDVGRVASAVYALGVYLRQEEEGYGSDMAILLSEVLERRVDALRRLTEEREG